MNVANQLSVYRHETLPPLATMLARTITQTSYADPLTETVVAVPSFAVARWLSDRLADATDGAYAHVANLRTPFPKTVIDDVLNAVLNDGANAAFTPERLTFTILAVLRRDLEDEGAYTALTQQLRPSAGQRSGVAFARHTAELFDRYIRHRPELLDRWVDGEDCDRNGQPLAAHLRWQAVLWRAVLDTVTEDAPHVRLASAIDRLQRNDPATFRHTLADRYSLFGMHALQQSELALLAAVARHRPVDLYLLTPCRSWPLHENFGVNNRWLDVFTRQAQAQHRQVANALAQAIVIDLDEETAQPKTTALAVLQQHLTTDTQPTPSDRVVVAQHDTSVSLHACHGIVRECDAVKDQILALLDADPTLELRDIAIVTPDVAAVAPLIAGVLADGDEPGQNVRNHPSLAFAIRDRSLAKANPLAETLSQLFALAQSRVTLNDIADLLQRDIIAEQLGLQLSEIGEMVALLRAAGVRWGIDGEHRHALSQIHDPAGSFAYGFDRILLGLAIPNLGERVLYDVSPYAALGTDDMPRFLSVFSFVNDLFERLAAWRQPHSLAGWVDETVRLLDTLLQPAPDAFQRHIDNDTIAHMLGEMIQDAGEHAEQLLSLAEYLDLFDRACAKRGMAGTSDTGITVSSLHGMRSLPFRVVCMLGMNDELLTNATADVVHDLIATQPDANDVTVKEETRQLVFDALINTTQHLIVTYTATDPSTGESKPIARILEDLTDLIDAHLVQADGTSALMQLTHLHPRQLTHPSYYDPASPLFRTDLALQNIAAATHTPIQSATVDALVAAQFQSSTSPPKADTITLTALIRTLQDPARAYLQRHGIHVVADEDTPEDRDLFALDGLARYRVYDEVMNWPDDHTLDAFIEAATYRGVLPTGSLGLVAQHDVYAFVTALRQQRQALADTPDTLVIDLGLAGQQLTGQVTRYGHTIVSHDASSNPVRTELAVWLKVLAATVATDRAHDGIVMFRDKKTVAARKLTAPDDVEHCAGILEGLAELGQKIVTIPTPLFARTSHAYARDLVAGKDANTAKRSAENEWFAPYSGFGEATKPAVRYLYGIDLPFDQLVQHEPFRTLAIDVFEPLVAARSKADA